MADSNQQTIIRKHCRYCGGGAVDLEGHEANCVMRPTRTARVRTELCLHGGAKSLCPECSPMR